MVDSLLEIITKIGNQKFYKSIKVHSVTNAIDEIGGKHDFSCGYIFLGQVINKLKERELCWSNE